MRPRAIDLFAGVGGFSLGLEQAGFDVVAAVEKDPVHALAHKYNFPETTTICADLASLTPKDLLSRAGLKVGELDLLAGGPPCQGFSLMGRRDAGDARNSLIFDFMRMVAAVRPRYFVMENVEGLVQGEMSGMVGQLLEAFEDSGYAVRFPIRIMNATNYGVPQNRKRVFLLGARKGLRQPKYPEASASSTPTVSDAIGDLPALEGYPRLFSSDLLKPRYAEGSAYARVLRGDAPDATDFSRPRTSHDEITGFRRARHTPEVKARFRSTSQGKVEPISRFLRLDFDGQAPTLRAGSGRERGSYSAPRPIHPSRSRCISVREAARLHGFPDWFGFHTTIWHGFRQVGNSVPPPLARVVGSAIIQALDESPKRPTEKLKLGERRWLTLSEALARKELLSQLRPSASVAALPMSPTVLRAPVPA